MRRNCDRGFGKISTMKQVATVLLADDERPIREYVTELLESRGFRVIVARDGREAVEAHRRETPDVIILDVMMPRMNGYEACREIRKVDSSVPILFFTALDAEADELMGLGLGADDFISKTASEEKIIGRVSAAARRVSRSEQGNFLFGRGFVDAAACLYCEDGKIDVRLTEREVLVLREFTRYEGAVLSKDWLLTRLFGIDYNGDPRVVDKIIERLRAKVGSSAETIVTVPRQGFAYQPHLSLR